MRTRALTWTAAGAGVWSFTVGSAAIAGWWIGERRLVQTALDGDPFALGAAVSMSLCGAALLLGLSRRAESVAAAVAACATLVALTRFLEYGFDASFGLAGLLSLASSLGDDASVMPPDMALGLALAGAGLISGGRFPLLMGACGSAVFVIGLVGTAGTATRLDTSVLWGVRPPTFLESTTLAVLGAGVYCAAGARVERARAFVGWTAPVFGALATAFASLYLWQLLSAASARQLDLAMDAAEEHVQIDLASGLRERVAMLRNIAAQWQQLSVTSSQERAAQAEILLGPKEDGLCRVERLAASGEVLEVYVGSERGCEASGSGRGTQDAIAGFARADVGIAPLTLGDGMPGLRLLTPFQESEGDPRTVALAVVLRSDVFFGRALRTTAESYSVLVSARGEPLYQKDAQVSPQSRRLARHFSVYDPALEVDLVPSAELVEALLSSLPRVVLASGIALAFLLGSALRLSHVARLRQQEADGLNAALSAQIEEQQRTEAEVRRLNGELEQRVEERTAELAKSNEELRQFASFLSHELRQPLGALSIWSELLSTSYAEDLDERGERYLSEISGCVRRIADMVSSQLALARVSSQALETEKFALGELLTEVTAGLKGTLDLAQASVEIGPLPVIDADRRQMYQLFRNLLENAVKYRRGDVALQIDVRAQPPAAAGRWCIDVRDNGRGFDEGDAERIFEHATRLDPSVPGSGVGLAICRRIAQRHGGTIRASARKGEGACFTVELPVSRCSIPPGVRL